MRKEVLAFLKHERDQLADRLQRLKKGEWEVVHANSGRENITATVVISLEDQVLRFEELIAASEAGVA